MEEQKEYIIELGRKVKNGEITWKQAGLIYSEKYGTELSDEAMRSRYKRLNDSYIPQPVENIESETHYKDGTIDICKKVWFDPNEEKTPETILKKFGYNVNEWELITWTFGTWEVAIKNEEKNRVCTTVRAKVKPKIKDISLENSIKAIQEVMSKSIKPFEYIKKETTGLDDKKLLELTGIELHLGKMAWSGDTGQDYDKDIAQERFYTIVNEVLNQQEIEKCGTCLLCIGNDFFNSDTVNATTTKGTPQTNDLRWKKMFNLGLEMYINFINELEKQFNHIEIRLQSGNHDQMASFYLYIALSCLYNNNPKISFSNDYKEVQCFEWGKCAIFFNHGDSNLKRLIKSIPCEFYKEWGRTIYRELHLGHLHKEVVVDDESGMITRRVGSPTGTDQWHYEERYIGATQKYQDFVWHKDKGLQNIKYINFESKKKLIKSKKYR